VPFEIPEKRRHLAALLISSSPFGSTVTDELLVRLGENIYPEWMRARLATPIRYLSNDSHRLRMLAFVDDPPTTSGRSCARAPKLQPSSEQAIRNSLGKA
jgi:hypothetical protein